MSWKTLKNNAKWRLKYELFRRILPRLEYEPFTIRHLSYKAWPTISALTSAHDYSNGIEFVEWQQVEFDDDGSDLLQARARESKPLILRSYANDNPLASWTMDDLKSEMGSETVTIRAGGLLV